MIIQCPKCQTKFSVSSELISELELPRFHCSRCDNVFDLDPRMPASFEESDMNSDSDSNNTTKTDFDDEPVNKVDPSLTQTIESPFMAEKKNSSTLEMSSDDLKKVASAVNNETEKSSKSLEIPKTYSPASPVSAPIESILEEGAPLVNPSSLPEQFASYKQNTPDQPKVEQLSMDLKTDNLLDKKEDQRMPYGISYGDPMTDESEPAPAKIPSSAYAFAEETAQPLPPARSGMASMGLFFMPIVFTLICASAISLYLIKSPSLAEALAGNFGVSLPKFAPAGMYIDNIKFNKITLDSGDTVYAISGRVKNDSLQKFKNVILEGFAFDKAGHAISASKTSAGNGLSDTRTKSLSMEMIKNMQGTKPAKKFELAANSAQDFLIVLSSEDAKADISKAQFFSARIHSVIE